MGLNGVIDNPARRALVSELVPSTELASAVSLIGVLVNGSRVVGPAIAAAVIALAGTTPCFLINGISYFAVVGALLLLNKDRLIQRPVRAPGPIRVMDTLRYVSGVPVLRRSLVSMTIVGTFTLEMSVTLPLIASQTFAGDGSTYGILLALMSIGGICGSLVAGAWSDPQLDRLEIVLIACFVAVAAAGLAPSLLAEAVALVFTGLTTFYYVAIASTGAQLNATPEHRGRVLALWSMAFLGTTMIGAPIIGWISNVWGPRVGLLAGAVACLAAAAVVYVDRLRMTGSTVRDLRIGRRLSARPAAEAAAIEIEAAPK
jgi:MFS family permease